MLSSKSWILFGIIALIAVVVIWKFWKEPILTTTEDTTPELQKHILDSKEDEPPSSTSIEPTPMVFAVNDQGNFDLSDMSGKLLNIGFGRNPKTYINLLDQAEKDISKDNTNGTMISNVGYTKPYEIGGQRYIVNFTRLV